MRRQSPLRRLHHQNQQFAESVSTRQRNVRESREKAGGWLRLTFGIRRSGRAAWASSFPRPPR
jgi:hypothetical protein